MFEFGSFADWVSAIAAVIAAVSSVWLMAHTLAAGRKARREREDARLALRVTRVTPNALKLVATWEPDDLARMVLMELTLLEPAEAVFQTHAHQPPVNPEAPWEGAQDVVLVEEGAGRTIEKDFRHWLNPRSEAWSSTIFVVWSESATLERARAKLRIIDEASRKVLMARTIPISPMN